jgi:hypothetical protein
VVFGTRASHEPPRSTTASHTYTACGQATAVIRTTARRHPSAAGPLSLRPSSLSTDVPVAELALLILANLALIYVLPGLLYLAMHRQRPVQTRPLSPENRSVEVEEAIAGSRSEFGEGRLSLVAAHVLGEGAAHVLHFVEPGTGVHALHYLTPEARWEVFLTRLDDGREVVTTSYPTSLTFLPHPRVHVVQFPRMRSRRLHALHAAHVNRVIGPTARAVLPADAELADFVAEHELRTLERQRELGAMVCRDGVYRPTAKAAFPSVWRMLQPMSWFHGRHNARLAQSLRAEVAPPGTR